MTVGAAFALVTPLLLISLGIESRTTKEITASESRTTEQIGKLEEKVEADVEELRRTLSESQGVVREKLREQRAQSTRQMIEFLGKTDRESVISSLTTAKNLGLLSPVGVRGASPVTDLTVRLQLRDNSSLWFFVDWQSNAGVFSEKWSPGDSYEDVLLALARKAEQSSMWPGDDLWNFEANFIEIGAVFSAAIAQREKGGTVRNVVQIFPDEWLISDSEVKSLRKQYHFSLNRLDQVDWANHLRTKPWVNEDSLDEMLDAARLIWQLANHSRI